MTIKDKLMMYVYRKTNEIENEKEELRRHLRYHPVNSLDMYEILRDEIRANAWKEFIDEIFAIIINCK